MAPAKKKKTAVTVASDMTALQTMDFGEHAGAGKQNMTSEDQAIPFLSLLQALSKPISDPAQKVEGAAPGMIMNSVSKKLYDGEEGVIFIPCNTSHVYVEWQGDPGTGSPTGRYQPNDPIVKSAKSKYAFNDLKAPNGNRLVETFYVIGMVLENSDDVMPAGMAVVSFTSTKIKAYKASIGEIRTIPGQAPLYAFKLRLTSQSQTGPKGTSFNFRLMPDGYDGNVFKDGIMNGFIDPSSEQGQNLFAAGKMLADDFDQGAANIAYDTEGSEGGTASEDEPY